MKKCPYCFEVLDVLSDKPIKCPHCTQFLIDPLVETDYRSLDFKKCIFCGKKIFKEARVCRYCKKWIDEVDRAVEDYDKYE
jgi:hypothetical protein